MIFKAMLTRKWVLTTLIVLLGTALCVRLGIWQLDRLEQRRAFNTHVQSMWGMDALILPDESNTDLAAMEYRAVQVSGVYDFDRQVALRNRYHQDRFGYHLLTPLLLEDGSAVLVDRGWIPAEGNDSPEDWRKYDQPGTVVLRGQIRQGQSRPDMGGVPDPTPAPGQTGLDFWNTVNLERISQQMPYPLLSVFIQPEIEETGSQPPIAYQPTLELSEGPHLGYAGQWFVFSALLFFGYPYYLSRQLAEKGVR